MKTIIERMADDINLRGMACEDSSKLMELDKAVKGAVECMAQTHMALHNDFDIDLLVAELTTAIYRLKEALYISH